MKYVSTISYTINLNKTMGAPFHRSRGLCQGDPLSPFLFLIYSRGLSTLMRLAFNEGLLKGAKASRCGP